MNALSQLGAKGFRPFFLLAGLFSGAIVPAWVLNLAGYVHPSGVLTGITWHAHEMIFGYTLAVIAGFLLTAVENWTRLPTLRGAPLLLAASVWLGARVLLWFPGWLGPALDLLFLPILIVGIGRPILKAGNTRNLPFIVMLLALWMANASVYLDAAGFRPGLAVLAHRVAVYVIAVIILVITGRVVPMFTRNTTGELSIGRWPWADRIAVGAPAVLATLQLGFFSWMIPAVSGVAGVATLIRMRPWWTRAVLNHPLLWVLHLGHLSVGMGLCFKAMEPWLGPLGSGPLHLVTVGGIGLLTIGMMSRVSLGHSGRAIQATRGMGMAFAAVGLAAVVRAVGPWADPVHALAWFGVAALLWAAAFAAFAVLFVPILVSPRPDGKPG